MKNLVIVESPSKSKTVEKYLGSDYRVVASNGHIRDLATTGKLALGVDIENDFKPSYVNISSKSKTVKYLKEQLKDSDFVYLATDPDREGEAISWHLKEALKLKDGNYKRVVFNEITKDKVLDAFSNPRDIDDDLVHSQETRRIIDRIIGFRLSNVIRSKTTGTSAGRVQSVALKLIVDREREIIAFVPVEYWSITALFKEFEAAIFQYKEEKLEINNKEEADKILAALSNKYKVESIEKKQRARKAKFPFITSTLQQEASSKLNFNAKKTMMVAQKLYEGITLEKETTGLITYMRTDSTRLSDQFIGSTLKYIETEYGKDYVGFAKGNKTTKGSKNIQDAHEAIRPTSIKYHPDEIKQYLSTDEYKLYHLIYMRALASLMKDAKVNQTTVILDNNDYKFKATGQILIFDGYLKVYKEYESSEDKFLPDLKENDELTHEEIIAKQHFTQPPARYTEARLIKELEELGIGRPSTYATIISTIQARDYVYIEEKRFHPTEVGMEVTDRLQEFFSDVINVKYTAQMEEELDQIADQQIDYLQLLKDFWKKFEPLVSNAFTNMEKAKPKETGEMCPECGHPLVIRKGRYGEFVACSNFPTCKYIKKEEKPKQEVKKIMTCPDCDGDIIERFTRKGKVFYGCSNFPKCKTAYWDLPTKEKFPDQKFY